MKKVFLGALAISSAFAGSAAFAGQSDDVQARLDALERENAAIRRENTALNQNKALRDQNAALKPVAQQTAPTSLSAELAPIAAKPASITDRMADFFGAYAADLPVAYKARPLPTPGLLRFWGEGGAIWSGGDPAAREINLFNFTGGAAGVVNLLPKIGWEGAAGFDYRFTDSLYHVSGQFRYGEGGKVDSTAATSGILNPALFFGAPLRRTFVISSSDSQADNYNETHWLADIAFGRDVAGIGPDAIQVKGGLRIQEALGTFNTLSASHFAVDVGPPPIPVVGNTFAFNTNNTLQNRVNFLGAGPLIGLQGSAPFAGKWSFDYTGDVAVLFGTTTSQFTQTSNSTVVPPLFNFLANNSASVSSTSRYATMMSGDIQAGFGYWFTPNIKVAASYRLDALINVNNVSSSRSVNNLQFSQGVFDFTPSRYTHGPRLTVTGQF